MKTSLSYLSSASLEAVEKQAVSPVLSDKEEEHAKKLGVLVIAGFNTYDAEAAEKGRVASLEARRNKLSKFKTDRALLGDELQKRGIIPLAMLPKVAWENICARTNLYLLEPNNQGQVYINEDILAEFDKQASAKVAAFSTWGFWSLLAMFAIANGYIFSVLGPWVVLSTAISLAVLITFAIVYRDRVGDSRDNPRRFSAAHTRVVRRLLGKLDHLTHEEVLKMFFPNGISPKYGKATATITLPPAPEDVSAILLKAQGLTLKTAAVGDAIMFTEAPSQIVGRKLDLRIEAENELRRQEWEDFMRRISDPIVYVERDSAVALIAQFGDFPIEKEAVDLALFSEHLI